MRKDNISDNNRILYLDVIRVVACFLVVLVHVAAQHIYDKPAQTWFFKTHAAYNCLAFSGVTLYIMISGALMLGSKKEITISNIIRRVIHFYFLYFLWKLIYYIFDGLVNSVSFNTAFVKNTIVNVASGRGHYHLWFLPTIAIIYLFVPLIKKSVENDKKVCLYYMVIFFAVTVCAQTMLMFNIKGNSIIQGFLEYNDFYLFTGYLGYYIWGHYLHAYGDEIKKQFRIFIYILAVVMLPFSGIADSYLSVNKGVFDISLNTPFSLPSFIMTTAIFLLIKNAKMPSNKLICKCIITASSMTLGIYLIHPMIIVLAEELGFSSLMFVPALSLLVVTFVTALVTMIPVLILINIPVIKKIIT